MQDSGQTLSYNPRFIRDKLFALAKRWFTSSLLCKLLGLGYAIFSVCASIKPAYLGPLITAVIAVASEIFLWRSDSIRSISDSLHRKIDLEDSFGWPISDAELSDIIADAPLREFELRSAPDYGRQFFDSHLPAGPNRGLANLVESAWWTKHLCSTMWKRCLVYFIGLVLVCFLLLYITLNSVKTVDEAIETSKVVTSIITFAFSIGLLRFTLGFFALSSAADKAERLARDLAASLVRT